MEEVQVVPTQQLNEYTECEPIQVSLTFKFTCCQFQANYVVAF
jgi:hypothetical protein